MGDAFDDFERRGYVLHGSARWKQRKETIMGNGTFEQQGTLSMLDNVVYDVEKSPPKAFVYGVHGIGKSSWLASAARYGHNPILMLTEDGAKQLQCAKTPVCKTMQEAMGYLKALLNDKHEFTMLGVDTLDWLEKLIWNEACLHFGCKDLSNIDYGKGYGYARGLWQDFIEIFDDLISKRRMMVVLMAHAAIQKIETPEKTYDCFTPKLHTNSKGVGIGEELCEWADILMFARYEEYINKDKEGFGKEVTRVTGLGRRMLYTNKGPSYNAKNRYSLPSEICMGEGQADFGIFWNAFCNSPVFQKKEQPAADTQPVDVEAVPETAAQ